MNSCPYLMHDGKCQGDPSHICTSSEWDVHSCSEKELMDYLYSDDEEDDEDEEYDDDE